MMDRRTFLKMLSATITALNLPTVSTTKRNGLEILKGTQTPDADYYQCTLLMWEDDKIAVRETICFTRTALKTVDKYQEVIERIVQEGTERINKVYAHYKQFALK